MLALYIKSNGLVQKSIFRLDSTLPSEILWIDLLHPTKQEVDYIEKHFGIEIPTKEESSEIELSARYWEDSLSITINSYFLIRTKSTKRLEYELINETVTFLMSQNILFTARYNEFSIFEEMQARVLASPKNFEDGFDVASKVFEIRVEKDADILEWVDKQARNLRKNALIGSDYTYIEILKALSSLQELNMSVRDSLFDKRRAMTALLTSDKIDKDIKNTLTIVLKDLNSLVEFNVSNLNVLDNIQTILANQVNIEQNNIIKLFTVVTVAMMPPTLIGTIYGMNFKNMPELNLEYGYFAVIVLMIFSTILPIIIFKKKGWL